MSVAKVLRLDQYRDRRTQRLRLAEALHGPDIHRRSLLGHLAEIGRLTGADRLGVVWLEEYGAGLIHPHVVLDQSCDRPRRTFSPEPLREAWELGVPSAHDRPAAHEFKAPATLAISLGSDGARAWFLVAESPCPRPAFDARVRDSVMFLAGECAALVLHRDLDTALLRKASATASFAGWRILEDLDEREPDEEASRRIAQRFVVGRLARILLDEEVVTPIARVADQVRRARAELTDRGPEQGSEGVLWHRVLDALEEERHEDLAADLVRLADTVEGMGHTKGALELYECAYGIAAALGVPRLAAEAARLAGRLLRRRADWDAARRWLETAHAIAAAADMPEVAARAWVGLAGIKRERGNLPGAREGLSHALALAEASGDREALALTHHAILGLEHQAGNLSEALEHGWLALASYESEEGRIRCMAGLGGALLDFGDREAAEDAWTLVAHGTTEKYYLVYAYDALGHICALRGDAEGFRRQVARCDDLGWETAPAAAKAEILYYRGLSHVALGDAQTGRAWLLRAVEFAEREHFNRTLIKAEEALKLLAAAPEKKSSQPVPAASPELREGLRAMRREVAGAAV